LVIRITRRKTSLNTKFTASTGLENIRDSEDYIPLYLENRTAIGKARIKDNMVEMEIDDETALELMGSKPIVLSIVSVGSLSEPFIEEVTIKEKMMSDTSNPPPESIWPVGTPLPEGVEAQQMVTDTLLSQSEIQDRFGFHKSTIEGPNPSTEVHKDLRFAFMQFADYLNNRLGKSRYVALAQTALEEASMWSHKAIATHDPIDPEA
jgi:hypothetical protein